MRSKPVRCGLSAFAVTETGAAPPPIFVSASAPPKREGEAQRSRSSVNAGRGGNHIPVCSGIEYRLDFFPIFIYNKLNRAMEAPSNKTGRQL